MSKKKSKPKYVSKDGFEDATILRGQEVHSLMDALPPAAFICGGHARWMVSPLESPALGSDLDIYCKDDATFNKVAHVLKKECGLKVRHKNEMAVSFKKVKPNKANDFAKDVMLPWLPRIQLIKPLVKGAIVAKGSPETILNSFDFTVTRAAIMLADSGELRARVDADFMQDESKRYLRIKNIHCPISSTLRCIKYSKKGYWTRPFEVLKLMLDWESRDDQYRLDLIDHLTRLEEGAELTQEQIDHLEALLRVD